MVWIVIQRNLKFVSEFKEQIEYGNILDLHEKENNSSIKVKHFKTIHV